MKEKNIFFIKLDGTWKLMRPKHTGLYANTDHKDIEFKHVNWIYLVIHRIMKNLKSWLWFFFYFKHICGLICGILLDIESRLTEKIFFFHLRGAWSKTHLKKRKYLCLNKFYSFLGALAKLRKVSVVSSYLSAFSSAGVKQWIFMNLDIWVFFEDVSRKRKFY